MQSKTSTRFYAIVDINEGRTYDVLPAEDESDALTGCSVPGAYDIPWIVPVLRTFTVAPASFMDRALAGPYNAFSTFVEADAHAKAMTERSDFAEGSVNEWCVYVTVNGRWTNMTRRGPSFPL